MSAIGSDDDIPDPLELCPVGLCPRCCRPVWDHVDGGSVHLDPSANCNWDWTLTVEQNRTRYAEEVLDDAYTEGRIIGDQRKYGAGREV